MKKLIMSLALALTCATHAQTTNAIPPKLKLTLAEGGVFVHYSAEVGRMYRLEESVTLTNWMLVEQKVADSTNMSFYFENPNITLVAPTNSGSGGGGGPAPSPSSTSGILSSEDTTAFRYDDPAQETKTPKYAFAVPMGAGLPAATP